MCRSQIIRNHKAARQNWRCIYCDQPMWCRDVEAFASRHGLSLDRAALLQLTAEHLQPQCEGGRHSYRNIAAACLYCNRMRHQTGKQNLSPADYARYVRTELRLARWHGISIGGSNSLGGGGELFSGKPLARFLISHPGAS